MDNLIEISMERFESLLQCEARLDIIKNLVESSESYDTQENICKAMGWELTEKEQSLSY